MQSLLETIRYNEGKFPRQELQQLIDNQVDATPHLLNIIEELVNHPDDFLDEPSRIDHIYALYLLAQFRETGLFPLLISLMSLQDVDLGEILDDVVTEGVGRMLASVFTEDISSIQQLIENARLDEFVRGQGLHAMAILVLHGKLEREWVVHYFRELLDAKASEDDPIFNAHIVLSLSDLYGEEAYDSIKRSYENHHIDTMMIGLDDVESILKMPKDAVLESKRRDQHFQFIDDTIIEMEWWACFEQERKQPEVNVRTNRDDFYLELQNQASKIVKIGRNAPCTCGSGKKYKKCCGK